MIDESSRTALNDLQAADAHDRESQRYEKLAETPADGCTWDFCMPRKHIVPQRDRFVRPRRRSFSDSEWIVAMKTNLRPLGYEPGTRDSPTFVVSRRYRSMRVTARLRHRK